MFLVVVVCLVDVWLYVLVNQGSSLFHMRFGLFDGRFHQLLSSLGGLVDNLGSFIGYSLLGSNRRSNSVLLNVCEVAV